MYYYNITEFNEFKERERDGVLYQYALLEDYDLKTLKEVLQNHNYDGKGSCLRELTEQYNRNEISEYQYIRLCKAIVDGRFAIKTKLKEPLFYVHVLPKSTEGYLNASQNDPDGFYFDTKKQWGGSQTKFTKEEIEELKKMPSLKGINIDECLEKVVEDED